MEHMNQEIEAYLCVFVSHQQDNWADWLPLAEFAYNNKIHAATCWTPFELDTGQHPCLGVEPTRTSIVEAVDTFTRQLDCAQEEVKAVLEQAADDMKQYYDQNCQTALEYKVRDKAWLSLQNYSSNCPHEEAGPQMGWSFCHYQSHLSCCHQTLALSTREECPPCRLHLQHPS